MPSYSYASLVVPVYADTRRLTSDVAGKAKATGEEAGKKAGKSWGSSFLATAGKAMAVVGATELFKSVIEAGEEAEKVNRATEAAIRSTGGAAHITAGQVSELAEAISRKTGVEDDTVKSGSNMLLTFTNVRNEAGKGNAIFDQATSILTDMTAAMTGGNVTSEAMRKQAIQLGKSLNDPVKGMGALQRVGVTFTEQQKKQVAAMVKSGDTIGAQKLILHELTKEFGGAAAAYATPTKKLHTAMHELAEQAGTALLPALNGVSTWLLQKGIPALMAFGGWVARNKTWLIPLTGAVASFVGTLYGLNKAFTVINAGLKILRINFALTLGPVALIIAGLIALGVGLYLLWTRSRTFRVIVEAAFNGVKAAAMAVINWFAGPFVRFFTVTIPGVFNAVLAWVRRYWPFIVGFLTGPIGIAVVLIIRYWTQIRTFIVNTATAIWQFVVRIFTNVKNFIGGVAGAVSRNVASWWNSMVSTIGGALARAWTNLSTWFSRLPGQVLSWGAAAVRSMTTLGTNLITGMFAGIFNYMKGAATWINTHVVQPVINAVKHFFGIHSPSTVMEGIGGNVAAGLIKGAMMDAGAVAKTIFGGLPAALGHIVAKGLIAITALPGKALSALGSVAGKIGGFFGKLFGGGGGGGGTAQWAGIMHAVTDMLGVSSLFSVFMTQMQTESGGNPKAINLTDINAQHGTPSKGLMQVIDPTFAAYAGPFRSRGIWDPLANIYAAVSYAIARYGANIVNVLGHGHGYAGGGIVGEPVLGVGLRTGTPYSFGERGPELVSPLGGAGPGHAGITINVYPQPGMSETAIAAAVNAELHWAAAGGRA